MAGRLRALGAAGAVAFVTVAAVFVGVSPAQAAATPPPIGVPSSVAGASAGSTPEQRAAAAGVLLVAGASSGIAVPVAEGTAATVTSAGGTIVSTGPAGAVSVGLVVGWYGANQVMTWMGVPQDEIGWTGVQNLLGIGTHPDAVYVPNADIGVGHGPGWVGSSVTDVYWQWCNSGCYVDAVGYTATSLLIVGLDYLHTGVLTVIGASPMVNPSGTIWARPFMTPSSGSTSNNVQVYAYCQVYDGYQGWHVGICGDQSNPLSDAVIGPGATAQWTPMGINAQGQGTRLPGLDHVDYMVNGVLRGRWFPVGSPSRPADFDSNPGRQWETRWTCQGGGAGSLRSAVFNEGTSPFPPFPQGTCVGSVMTGFSVWEIPSVGSVPAAQQVFTWSPSSPLIDWQTNYPQCSNGSCRLELFRVDPTTQGRVSCFANPEACVNWSTDPQLTGQMQCTYAGADVALSECNAYTPTFNVATGTQIQTSTGIEQSTDVQPYADPLTGEPQPNPNPVPNPGPTPDAPDGCPPAFSFTLGGVGYWVTKGAECALAWAFIPPGGLVAGEVQQTSDVLSVRPPWSLAVPIGAMFTGVTSGWSSGCSEMLDFDSSHHHLSLPCNPPSSDSMVVLRWFMTVVLVVGAGFGVWHMLVAAIGGNAAD